METTTNKSRIDQVRDISAQLTHHEGMVAHLTRCLGVLIEPPPSEVVLLDINRTSKSKKTAQPKKAKGYPYKKAAAKPGVSAKSKPWFGDVHTAKPDVPAKGESKVVKETKRQILQAISQKPKIFSQIKKSVGHSYRVVKRAITELERENKIMTLEVKNKRRGISTAYAPISATKKTTR
jgi:hypothetical protein